MAEPLPGRAFARFVAHGPGKYQPPRTLGSPWCGALSKSRLLSLYLEICSWRNLSLAFAKAAKGKRGHPNVARFEHRLEENLLALRSELLNRTYRPGNYDSFYIHEPKRRLISAAPFRDRVVHHALCNVIEPLFDRGFIHDSYANRVQKGTHRALDRCQELARRYAYVLQCDIEQFFPAIDHGILRKIVSAKIADESVLWLVDRILGSGNGILDAVYKMAYFKGDDLFACLRPRGLPIGNLTSQFWANCYLCPFDHFVKRELCCAAYLRYVDDFLLFSNEKEKLWQWRRAIIERLERFRLTVHRGAHPRPVTEGIPFLGFTVFPGRRRLKRRKGVRFQRKLRGQATEYASGQLTLDDISAGIQGWINHVRYGNTVGLRKSILGSVRFKSPISNQE